MDIEFRVLNAQIRDKIIELVIEFKNKSKSDSLFVSPSMFSLVHNGGSLLAANNDSFNRTSIGPSEQLTETLNFSTTDISTYPKIRFRAGPASDSFTVPINVSRSTPTTRNIQEPAEESEPRRGANNKGNKSVNKAGGTAGIGGAIVIAAIYLLAHRSDFLPRQHPVSAPAQQSVQTQGSGSVNLLAGLPSSSGGASGSPSTSTSNPLQNAQQFNNPVAIQIVDMLIQPDGSNYQVNDLYLKVKMTNLLQDTISNLSPAGFSIVVNGQNVQLGSDTFNLQNAFPVSGTIQPGTFIQGDLEFQVPQHTNQFTLVFDNTAMMLSGGSGMDTSNGQTAVNFTVPGKDDATSPDYVPNPNAGGMNN